MNPSIKLACDTEILQIPLAKILPLRKLDDKIHTTAKYKCIEASIKELGLIEPIVVYPQKGRGETEFILLDGHVRVKILHSMGISSAKCLISTDDEGYTYNHKISRLSAIQEHFMIRKAIKNGVSEERIARCLDIDVKNIIQKRDLLSGICSEAVILLKQKDVSAQSIRELRKVRPIRQIEIAELMCASHAYHFGYVRCLVATTPTDLLIEVERDKEIRGLTQDEIDRMEHEMANLGKEFKLLEESHGKNTLNLVISIAYLKKLTENNRINKYLHQNYPEMASEIEKLIAARVMTDNPPSNGI